MNVTREIVLVSDGIGETAEAVARAALSQFDDGRLPIRKFARVEDETSLTPVLEYIHGRPGAVVIYTVVQPEVRNLLTVALRTMGLVGVDVMGPVMSALETIEPVPPKLQPGLVHRLDAGYFRRVAAVEFAVNYDDGKDPRGLLLADVVLIGVSRSSKTPVSMYLANRQVMVANVPLLPEVPLPEELFEVRPGKIVGLMVDPEVLARIRAERVRAMGLPPGSRYAEMERIVEELEYARSVYRRLRCHVIDVSRRAVEETASMILEAIGRGGASA